MAIDLSLQYPGRVVVNGANPRGTFKDSTFPGALDGTPAQFAWARDMWALLEKIMDVGGLVASGTPDTAALSQRYAALVIAARNIWPIWDAVNVYVKGAITIGSDDLTYQSLLGGNFNKNPLAGSPWWSRFPALATNSISGTTFLSNQRIISSNNLADPAKDIDFSGGKFIFDDGTGEQIVGALTKQLDAVWGAGNNQGGNVVDVFPAPGVQANQTYYSFAIYNPTSGARDYMFDTSITGANIPIDFTKKSRVWAITTDASSNIIGVLQIKKQAYLKVPVLDVNVTDPGVGPNFHTLSVPIGLLLLTNSNIIGIKGTGADSYGIVYSPLIVDPVIPSPSTPHNLEIITIDSSRAYYNEPIPTNNLGQIKTLFSLAGPNLILRITTFGWQDITLEN